MKKNITTGTGLALLAGALVAFPFAQRLAGTEREAHGSLSSAAASLSAVAAPTQTTPTIVWYGTAHNDRFAFSSNACNATCINSYEYTVVLRAWSDGTVEAKKICTGDSCSAPMSAGGWTVVSTANQGFASSADLNFDQQVDGADLGTMLAFWGAAPRHDITPSDCPLNLVNP
jgi:hypothetical protein